MGRFRVVFLIALLISGAAALYSQGSPAGQGATRLEIEVVQVPLLVTVTDSKGQLITTLGKESFKLYEGNRLQRIDSFSRDTDLPLSIALLVDQSSSAVDQIEFERAAAMEFFKNTVKRGKDRAMITFARPVTGRYVRFVALKGIDGQKFASVAELDVILPENLNTVQ